MPGMLANDPILKRFRAALDMLYGDRIERVVLFGSRARGDAREDSDYDVAVFLKSLADRWQEVDRIVPIVTDILYEEGAFIHAMPHRAGSYEDRTSLMREIRRGGGRSRRRRRPQCLPRGLSRGPGLDPMADGVGQMDWSKCPDVERAPGKVSG